MNGQETLFPRTKDFARLFDVHPSMAKDQKILISPICQASAAMYVIRPGKRYTLSVLPKKKVIDKLAKTLVVSADDLFWEAIQRDDGTLLLVRYNHIIGSRWIAIVDTKTISKEMKR